MTALGIPTLWLTQTFIGKQKKNKSELEKSAPFTLAN